MERITDAEATAERQRKLAIQGKHSQRRYEIGIQSCDSTLIRCQIHLLMHRSRIIDVGLSCHF